MPPWPLLVLAGEWHVDDPHEVLLGDAAVWPFVNLHQLLVLPCGPHWDDEAPTWLQLFY